MTEQSDHSGLNAFRKVPAHHRCERGGRDSWTAMSEQAADAGEDATPRTLGISC
jgi:hypothetical protein